MNKIISKEMFIQNGIKTPKYFSAMKKNFKKTVIQKKIKQKKICYPIVIKPINEGSSLGVEICKNRIQLFKKAQKLFKTYEDLIFEEYIGGQEIQVAVINNVSLGAIELIPRRLFYDYKAKYTKKAKTKHIMPANLDKKKYKEVLEIAKKTHKFLKCKELRRF